MKKSAIAIALAAGALLSAVATVPASVQAQPYYQGQRYHGPGYYYGPGYVTPPQSYYYGGAPGPVADPTGPCYWQSQRFWDGYGWRMRSVRVCG